MSIAELMLKPVLLLLIFAAHLFSLRNFHEPEPLIIICPAGPNPISTEDYPPATIDLGYGFKIVQMPNDLPNSPELYEPINHSTYLYHFEKKISLVWWYSISPSGEYAIYQDGLSGKIFVINMHARGRREVSSAELDTISSFDWQEKNGVAYVYFNNGLPGFKFNLKGESQIKTKWLDR